MPAPHRHRHRPPASAPAPTEPLGAILREYEQWRNAQPGKPSRGALRDYWRQRDQRHGQRPDYVLWRQTQCPESPPERRVDPVDLAVRALRTPDPNIHQPALAFVPALLMATPPLPAARREELLKAMSPRLGALNPASGADHSFALMGWICRAAADAPSASNSPALLKELQDLITIVRPDWKPGRSVGLGFLNDAAWLPVAAAAVIRWVAAAIIRMVEKVTHDAVAQGNASSHGISLRDAAAWHLTAWAMLRDARPPQSLPRVPELEVLLSAACTARAAGNDHEAARLTALVTHLLPPQAPESLLHRCRVAAWTLAEAGLAPPPGLRVTIEEMPFPGDPPASEKGQEAARLFHDPADISQKSLAREVVENPAWQRLRATGAALHHPLPALAWIGRKSQSYALKKQHDLLQTAAELAARHHCLGTTGRILAQFPGPPSAVVDYARAMRQSLRRMPLLRDAGAWQDWCASLRAAWGRLDTDAIHDPELLFMLHETLLDREVTTLRSLPIDLRLLALRHLHSRRQPSALVQALEADPRLMQSLEHQRPVELWSLAAELRNRPEQARTAWVSLVLRGDAAAGRYSLLVHGPNGTVHHRGRLRPDSSTAPSDQSASFHGFDLSPLIQEILETVGAVCESPEWLLLAVDSPLGDQAWQTLLRRAGLTASVAFIPSWEWAFRVLREAGSPDHVPLEILAPDGGQIPAAPPAVPDGGALAQSCVLIEGTAPSDANTRWAMVHGTPSSVERAQPRRSLSIGAHPCIVSCGPLGRGALNVDLARLSLAQTARCVIAPATQLTASQHASLAAKVLQAQPGLPLSERLRNLTNDQPEVWLVAGLPWPNDGGLPKS